ncbi:MAG: RdgB/HAM1 family non-canonical purine NTP pyrophosphatase [Myxococcales bacterium]|jgi:XTP/dITP diphosphohydrolase|nr:RdgB/HAM1 family non-canonical purine NTP pyrophosphatase [Myxococcales bacterium]
MPSRLQDLLFATTNQGKLAEFSALAMRLGLELRLLCLRDVAPLHVEEDAPTFEQNALKKARVYVEALGLPTLADDTGLCVDALDGAPGVFSARYGGVAEGVLDDAAERYRANNARLLRELSAVPAERRTAHFETAICLWVPGQAPVQVAGRVDGRILTEPRGTNGFGYDPLFEVTDLGRTLAELTREEKNACSHRARAFEALRPVLERWALS